MKIEKSYRKSITLRVNRDWMLIVKAPYLTSRNAIDKFVLKHKDWIDKRKSEINNAKKSFVDWESLFYMWDEYQILYLDSIKKISLKWNDILIPEEFRINVEEKLIQFYKREARKYIEIRLENIANLNNLEFSDFRITSARTRWWSCSSKKTLNFTFRLILAPLDVIDYVIIHELAHLKHMNHSKNFRLEVASMSKKLWLYDYEKSKKWLKDNGEKISYI